MGAIGRVVAVRFESGIHSVSRCTARDLLAGLGDCISSIHKNAIRSFKSLVRILLIDVPIA